MIDSTSVRAHRRAATAKRGIEIIVSVAPEAVPQPKIHAVVDAQGLPIRLGLTAGQAQHGRVADTLLDHLGPRTIVLADKAYDAAIARQHRELADKDTQLAAATRQREPTRARQAAD